MDINRIVTPKEKRNFINETLKEVNDTNFVKDFEKIIQENIKLNKTMAYFAVDYDKEKQQKYLNEAEKSEKVEKSIADKTIPTILDEDTKTKIIDPTLVEEYQIKNGELKEKLSKELTAMQEENLLYQEFKKYKKTNLNEIEFYTLLNNSCDIHNRLHNPEAFSDDLMPKEVSHKRFELNYTNAFKQIEKFNLEFNKIEVMPEKQKEEYIKKSIEKNNKSKGAER